MEKTNIIFILTDQHRCDMLGCYGNSVVRTPNIDALARDGIRFDRAFTPSSICQPARASLFTGLFPTTHGIVGNGPTELRPGTPTLSDHLSEYEKIYIGKWHVTGSSLPRDFGFSGHNFDGYGYPGSGVYDGIVFNEGPKQEPRYGDWLREKGFPAPRVNDAYFGENPNLQVQELRGKLDGPTNASIPHFLVDDAKMHLDRVREGGNPFFLWMNFWGPHTPCLIPEPYYSMYDPDRIPEDPAFHEEFGDKPVHYEHISRMWGVRDLPWSEWAKIIARYYGYITLIDDCIGDLIRYLRTNDLYDNTLIVFTADHGDAMGAHRLIEKGEFMFDETYRIPLVVRHPQSAVRGGTCGDFVYLHDLNPTAAEIACGRDPGFADSKSIMPLILGEKDASNGRDFVYGQFAGHFSGFEQRMLRTKTHKLVFNAPCAGELYDLVRDPHEMTNRFSDPACREIKRDLIARLHAEMIRLKDPLVKWLGRVRDFY